MIRLFHYEDYEVKVDPEAIMLTPFKTLWDRDKKKEHSMAKMEFAYIYFVADPRSDYQYLTNETDRSNEVIRALGMPKGWKPDQKVKEALEFYKSFKPISAGLLEDTRYAVDKLRELLRNVDLEERNDKGSPVYTLASITSTIKQIPTLVKELDEAERTLAKDVAQDSKVRGATEKNVFEDL